MNIIVLVGPNSCGKTTILNIVYDNLILNGATVTVNKQLLGGNPKDFSAILNWKKKKIAIFSMGDLSKALVSAVLNYNQQRCDVMICACNVRLVKPFKVFTQYNTTRVNKVVEPNRSLRSVNDATKAQEIVNLI
jgi:ABC-type branched-subunit amino acid transport system ATPase component